MSIERKPRQTVTEEKYEIIKRFHQAGRKISEVANFLNFSMKTISRLYKKIENNIPFVSRNKVLKNTIENKNNQLTDDEAIIYNTLMVDNTKNLAELREIVAENTGKRISSTTISRKIKKVNFSHKRISLVPIERNSEKNLDVRCIYSTEILRFDMRN
ncbi:hypothetical protein H311_01716 [Anncaliia algerae PRA109]|nr:hypothetical protein H311_01716 [Anncaliia algerae PRA109]